MNDLVVAERAADWRRLKALVLDSVSSPITKRVYNLGLDEFISWYLRKPRPGFAKATVAAWRVSLEARGLGPVDQSPSTCESRPSANWRWRLRITDYLRRKWRPAFARIKGVRSQGVRTGNWLSLQQAQALLNAPNIQTLKGLRDRAMFAILLGCGVRRAELATLTFGHLQQRESLWCILDLVAKHGRVRTVPMPPWVKTAVDDWSRAAGIFDGRLFREINRGDRLNGANLSEKVVWQVLKTYLFAVGDVNIAPHDLRRTTAKLCRASGGELEQIQLLLGHSSVQTTERYLGTKQDLVHAPNDAIKLDLSVK
jgi:integrase